MSLEGDVRAFLHRWCRLTEERDADRAADLYLRDPHPMVTFSDGARTEDWLDVRVRLQRDFERVFVERVETHDLQVRDLGDVVLASFAYDIQARDMWGISVTGSRFATLTLVRTKDGFRIAAAHFATAR